MEEDENLKTREELKEYFETGDYPTQTQFAELIDSYAHLNEFNFGLSVRSSGDTLKKYYHFYWAENREKSGAGHKAVEAIEDSEPEIIEGYEHILSRNVFYKNLDIELIGGIDIIEHQPKIIIERYRQRKKFPSKFIRAAGFYKEDNLNATQWNRKSEYNVDKKKIELDIQPINYFKPARTFKEFAPSGSLFRPGSYKYSMHEKPFEVIQLVLEIKINGIAYRSKPVGLKIILGSSGDKDAVNFLFD